MINFQKTGIAEKSFKGNFLVKKLPGKRQKSLRRVKEYSDNGGILLIRENLNVMVTILQVQAIIMIESVQIERE